VDYTVAAVDEALGLLFLVAQYPGLGVTELAKRSGNTKARAFRLLSTLEQRGLVQHQSGQPVYQLGFQALQLGAAAQEQVDLVRLANSCLLDIGARCNENTQVRVRDGLDSVMVAGWESTQTVRVHAGNRRSLHAGSSGKVLLAYAPEEIRQAVLSSELQQFTPNTIIHRSKLAKELLNIKARGYGTSFGEFALDAASVAAPVRDSTGNVIATLSIAGPSSRIRHDNSQLFIDLALLGAKTLSQALGYVPEKQSRASEKEIAGKIPAAKPSLRRQKS
jgi:IclR family transcriptional regulator, KDG regulon repressor